MTLLDWRGFKTSAIDEASKERTLILTLLKRRPCLPNDLTIRHLEMKLKRYERRIAKPNAKQSDYITRDRVAHQLREARAYLC